MPDRLQSVLRHWHPVCRSDRLGRRPEVVRLAGRTLVLFRTQQGTIAALDDCCRHRRMRLSVGSVVGDRLVCRYHGWSYGTDGSILTHDPARPPGCMPTYQVQEHRGLLWVRQGSGGSPLPDWDPSGLRLAGLLEHRVPGPLELTLDNFTEVEHTTTVHQVFGFRDPTQVRTRCRVEGRTSRVWNQGPQKGFPPLFNSFIDPRPDDTFANDWETSVEPPLTIYDQYWTSPQGQLRRFRLKVVMFFVPEDERTTRLFTYVYSRSLLGPLYPWLVAPIIAAITRHELNLDVQAIAQLADLRTDLDPTQLGRFDRPLLENRRLLAAHYYAD